jgi:hypothetical protein
MNTVYLKDGSMANFIAKSDNGYVVDPLMTYKDDETGEEWTEPSGRVKVVDVVYAHAPKLAFDQELKEISDKVEEFEKQLSDKRSELSQLEYKLKNTKTNLNQYIINREQLRNAKRLIVFRKDAICPMVMDGGKSYEFTVSYKITQYKEEERCWVAELWSEDRESRFGNTNYFDAEYGIMTDLTDEQIKEITFERQDKRGLKGFYENQITHTGDEWLTPVFQAEKRRLIEFNKGAELRRVTEELKKAQYAYDRIVNKAAEVL